MSYETGSGAVAELQPHKVTLAIGLEAPADPGARHRQCLATQHPGSALNGSLFIA